MSQLFIQMSGTPGSGKSTVARGVGQAIDAVIIDHDVSKTALLGTGLEEQMAGKASYEILLALAPRLLEQGHHVILDSPCLYDILLARGQAIAANAGAQYLYIECQLDDLKALDSRLRGRQRMPSQVASIDEHPRHPNISAATFRSWQANMSRPDQDYLLIDTAAPADHCIQLAIGFVRQYLQSPHQPDQHSH